MGASMVTLRTLASSRSKSGASRRFHIGERTHDAPTNTPTKMKINTVPATSKPNVDPMAELKMFFQMTCPKFNTSCQPLATFE